MTAFEYIKERARRGLNWNILPQLFDQDELLITPEIEKYIKETPWNTNPVILQQLINECAEEGKEDEGGDDPSPTPDPQPEPEPEPTPEVTVESITDTFTISKFNPTKYSAGTKRYFTEISNNMAGNANKVIVPIGGTLGIRIYDVDAKMEIMNTRNSRKQLTTTPQVGDIIKFSNSMNSFNLRIVKITNGKMQFKVDTGSYTMKDLGSNIRITLYFTKPEA